MNSDDHFQMLFYGFILIADLVIAWIRDTQKPKPCHHGITGPCRASQAAAEAYRVATEQNARRVRLEIEWEQLRRTEIKGLSLTRLRSSEAYFKMGPREFEGAVMKVFRKLGYRVNQTAYVGDGGKDAIAWKGKKKYVID
jgi:hypothetical protein